MAPKGTAGLWGPTRLDTLLLPVWLLVAEGCQEDRAPRRSRGSGQAVRLPKDPQAAAMTVGKCPGLGWWEGHGAAGLGLGGCSAGRGWCVPLVSWSSAGLRGRDLLELACPWALPCPLYPQALAWRGEAREGGGSSSHGGAPVSWGS